MIPGLPSVPGFWPDYYLCRKDNIIETINRMLTENASDFPSTACGGFTVKYENDTVKIIPTVLRGSG